MRTRCVTINTRKTSNHITMAHEEEDLTLNLSSYSEDEIKQLRHMTVEVKSHWTSMLKEHSEKINEATKMAIQMSIDQADDDLKVIDKELENRQKMNVVVETSKGPDG
jgi:hypothetical protein